MATIEGCLDLLTFLGSLDQKVRFDRAIAMGWATALNDVPDEVLLPAGRDAARAYEHAASITVGMIEKHAQPYLRRMARDARSARLRGLVPNDWPDTRQLPADVTAALHAEFTATNDPAKDHAAINPTAERRLGQIGRDA